MRRRLRSTIKWSCTVLTVLLLVVWVGSAFACAGIDGIPTMEVFVGAGGFTFHWEHPWSWWPPQWEFFYGLNDDQSLWEWWFFGYSGPGGWTGDMTWFFVPAWFVALLNAVPTAWLWYRDRRRAPGLCAKCGYDLRGAKHPVCPECGEAR